MTLRGIPATARRFVLASSLVSVVAISACAPAKPSGIDQIVSGSVEDSSGVLVSNNSCYGPPTEWQAAQVFTAGRTGDLYQVSLVATREHPSGGGEEGLTVTVNAVDLDEKPTDDVLGGATYTGPGSVWSVGPPQSVTWTHIPLDAPVPVAAGQQYAIVISTAPTAMCGWWDIRGSNQYYWGGDAWGRNFSNWSWTEYSSPGTFDLHFIDWVH